MVMQTIQIRLTKELIERISVLVGKGIYSSISEAVRDSVRRLVTGVDVPITTKEVELIKEGVRKELKRAFKRATGTIDFFPEDMAIRNKIFNKLRETAAKYNYKEIETPAFETLELLTKKEGEEIKKQIFTLEKKGSEEFGLRFDITVPATRMFIEKQKTLPKPVKWFYITRMWRYERPQKGRLREFYQFGVECFGSSKPESDAEVISLLIDSLLSLGLTKEDFFVKINNRKLLVGLLKDITKEEDDGVVLKIVTVIDKKNKITEKEFFDELKKANLSEDKIVSIKRIIEENNLAEIEKYCKNGLSRDGLNEIKSILKLLGKKKSFVKVDLSTARGLAYYTGTVFEVYDSNEKYRALAGGGRYDKLVELFNGEPTPATGFGLGYATLLLLLKEKALIPEINLSPDYYIAIVNKEVKDEALDIASRLRKDYTVEIDLMGRNLGNQFKYANSIKARRVIIVGPDELSESKVKIKDMVTGQETLVELKELFKSPENNPIKNHK